MTVMNSPAGLDAASAGGCLSTEQLLATHPSSRAVWGETDSSTLICRQVQDITHDVRTFLFESVEPSLFQHEPGQFITLQLEIDGRPVSRCYTISSPPTRPHLLGITVKRQPGGLVSNWLHDTMAAGQRISADGPFGVFTIARHPSTKYLFLSGGSGITPVMSMTRALYDLGSDADIVFVHSARTPSDIIFRRELETIASTVPTARVVHVCERDSPWEAWGGLRGFLNAEMLQLLAPDLAERVVFCCGPAPYMAAVRRMLDVTGFDMRNYHEESFNFEDLRMKEFSASPTTDAPRTTSSRTTNSRATHRKPTPMPLSSYAVAARSTVPMTSTCSTLHMRPACLIRHPAGKGCAVPARQRWFPAALICSTTVVSGRVRSRRTRS